MRKKISFILITIFLIAIPSFSYSEIIKLMSGQTYGAEILERTDKELIIEFDEKRLTLPLVHIESIDGEKVNSPIYFKKGVELALEGNFEKSAEEIKKSLEEGNPGYQITYNVANGVNKGIIGKEYAVCLFQGIKYLLDQYYEEGIAEFQNAAGICPDCPYAYVGLANIYKDLEDYTKAKENFLKAKELFQNKKDLQGSQIIDAFLKKLP